MQPRIILILPGNPGITIILFVTMHPINVSGIILSITLLNGMMINFINNCRDAKSCVFYRRRKILRLYTGKYSLNLSIKYSGGRQGLRVAALVNTRVVSP